MLARLLMDELGLMRWFSELTGETDSAARCTIMYLDLLEHDYFPRCDGTAPTEGGDSPADVGELIAREPSIYPMVHVRSTV